MFRSRKGRNDKTIAEIEDAAWKLGLEVGERGHLEGVGWVKSELREIERKARELGVLEVVMEKYETAKREGKKRRKLLSQSTSQAKKEAERKRPFGSDLYSKRSSSPSAESGEDIVIERVSVRQGIQGMITLMKIAQKNPELRKKLNHLFAGMSDIHDKLGSLEPEDDPRKTLEKAMQLLLELGWLESYDIKSFEAEREEVKLEATSEFARMFGVAGAPICQPICNVLETIGGKCFGKPMVAVEDNCMANGNRVCIFRLLPRGRQ